MSFSGELEVGGCIDFSDKGVWVSAEPQSAQ
jgi:hypothetical protein